MIVEVTLGFKRVGSPLPESFIRKRITQAIDNLRGEFDIYNLLDLIDIEMGNREEELCYEFDIKKTKINRVAMNWEGEVESEDNN